MPVFLDIQNLLFEFRKTYIKKTLIINWQIVNLRQTSDYRFFVLYFVCVGLNHIFEIIDLIMFFLIFSHYGIINSEMDFN